MTAVAPNDTIRLRRVFELERDRGCDNKAVMGGLDRMLIQMAEDGIIAPQQTALGVPLQSAPPMRLPLPQRRRTHRLGRNHRSAL